jgi:predicted nucleic acid-binding protein
MTPPVVKTYVFDASALFHFVAADRLDSLGSLMPSDARSVTTRAVQEELLAKEAEVPLVRLITSAGWLEQVPVDGLEDLWALSTWVQRIGADQHHRGEATVLAYAEGHSAIAIVDDKDARLMGSSAGLEVHGSLWLIVEACRHRS